MMVRTTTTLSKANIFPAPAPEVDRGCVDIDAHSLAVIRRILHASGDSALARSYSPSCRTPAKR
jgi:hypothetical protein